MELVRIRLNELESFLSSDLYLSLDIKPISPLRVQSYIANPRSCADDYVLYFFHAGNELIAFRTLFADYVFADKKPVKFAWCSGVWVAPKYRGKKLWRVLLKEALKDWDNRLMTTNYASLVERLYLNSNFGMCRIREGYRFYLFPDFKKILGNRRGFKLIKPILPLFSKISRIKSNRKLKKHFVVNGLRTKRLQKLDNDCLELINLQTDNSVYKSSEKELEWIIDYPWITEKNTPEIVYPFSYGNLKRNLEVVKVYKLDEFAGFFIHTIVRNRMKVLYHFSHENQDKFIANEIVTIALQNEIEYLTIIDVELATMLLEKKKLFAFVRDFSLNILSTFIVPSAASSKVFDGDGDNCFT